MGSVINGCGLGWQGVLPSELGGWRGMVLIPGFWLLEEADDIKVCGGLTGNNGLGDRGAVSMFVWDAKRGRGWGAGLGPNG